MTMLNATPRDASTPTYIRRRIDILLARIGRLINGWVAAAIARRERQAALYMLRRFSDRELKDIGLCRGDLDYRLEDAAKYRNRSWRSRGSE
jgi:uncharacterized protein YjiS (DUF1127 family)